MEGARTGAMGAGGAGEDIGAEDNCEFSGVSVDICDGERDGNEFSGRSESELNDVSGDEFSL